MYLIFYDFKLTFNNKDVNNAQKFLVKVMVAKFTIRLSHWYRYMVLLHISLTGSKLGPWFSLSKLTMLSSQYALAWYINGVICRSSPNVRG